MHRRVILALAVALTLAGTAVRSRDLFEPWSGLHKAWGGAMYGNVARNLLRYDPAETRLAPLTNTGPVAPPGDYTIYYHYPPLLVTMVAASFRVFGVHEGSARLVPLAFSLLTLALVFAFTRRYWGDRAALLALAVAASLPVETYYADHVDVYGPPAAFFAAAAIAAYAWWLDTRRSAPLVLCLAALLAGCLTAWYAYFAAGLLAAHALWMLPRERRPARWVPAALVGCGVLVFAGFLLHRRIVLGPGSTEVAGTLLEKLAARTGWLDLAIPTPEGLIPVSLAGFLAHLGRDMVRMYGPVALVLAAVWAVGAGRALWRRTLATRDGVVLMLLGYGLLHGLAFPMLLPGHDFLLRSFAVGLAVAAGVGLDGLGRWVAERRSVAWARAGLAVAVAVLTVTNVQLYRRLAGGSGEQTKLWATFVREATPAEALVVSPGPEDQVWRFYLDRRAAFGVRSPAVLDSVLAGAVEVAFAVPEREVEQLPDLVTSLDARAPAITWRGLRLYQWTRQRGGGR